jgi:peptidase E
MTVAAAERHMTLGGTKSLYLLSGGTHLRRKAGDPLIGQALLETGRERPSVAYVGAASGDDLGFFRILASLLHRAGAGSVALAPLCAPDADLRRSRALMEEADVIFLSGGDVDMGMQVLTNRDIVPLLHERFRDGAVCAGLSAGSILLCRQWVRWRNPDDAAGAETFDCLGLAPLVCDTHSEEDGWEELKTLLSLRRASGEIGYGIPTGGALRIRADGRVEALGHPVHRHVFSEGHVEKIADLAPVRAPPTPRRRTAPPPGSIP